MHKLRSQAGAWERGKLTTNHWLLTMPIPVSYSYRNLLARRLTTFLIAGGMVLVGGFLPSLKAARLPLLEALRAA